METNVQDILDEVFFELDGKKYTTTEAMAKDIKNLGYVVTEISSGDYIAFKVKGTKLSFLAYVSDTKPYQLIDVDTDIVFDDEDEDEKEKKQKKDRNKSYKGSYSVNYGKGYEY